jgi:hypothetical protein
MFVQGMREETNTHRDLLGNSEVKREFINPRSIRKDNIKMGFMEKNGSLRARYICQQSPLAGSCEHGNELF